MVGEAISLVTEEGLTVPTRTSTAGLLFPIRISTLLDTDLSRLIPENRRQGVAEIIMEVEVMEGLGVVIEAVHRMVAVEEDPDQVLRLITRTVPTTRGR